MHATYLTKKKILLSLAVFAGAVFLFSIGTWINNSILNGAEQKARMYQTAIQTKGDDQLNYSIDTKQGRILTSVTVKAADLVKFDEMNKSFPYVKKTEERYERKTREVCETHYRTETRTRTVSDGQGGYDTETYTEEVPYEVCHTETYYEWDFVQDWEQSAKEVDMAGRKYPIGLFSLRTHSIDAKEIIPGATGEYVRKEAEEGFFDINFFDSDDEGDIRYSFDVMDLPQSGTVFLNVTESVQPVFGSKINLESNTPSDAVKNAQNAAQTQSTIFWFSWGFLMLLCICAGVYFVWFYEYSSY